MIFALKNDRIKIYKYLLDRGAISSPEDVKNAIKNMLDLINYSSIVKNRKYVVYLYDLLLPKTYKYLTGEKRFWNTAINKLEEWNNDPMVDINDVYNKRIDELKQLAGI